jgi:peptide/nickel transport system permease protein
MAGISDNPREEWDDACAAGFDVSTRSWKARQIWRSGRDRMSGYLGRRLLLAIPTFLLITMAVFLSVRFIPGDIVDLMVAQMGLTTGSPQEVRQLIEDELGLNVPLPTQYLRWLGAIPQQDGQFRGLLEGNLGNSLWKKDSIVAAMGDRLPVSLELGFIAIVTALVMAIPIGIYSAIRQDTWGDYIGRSLSIIFISVPSFWLATMVMVYPGIWWGWSPPIAYIQLAKNPSGNLLQFLLPGFIMGMVMSGGLMRMTRTMTLEVLRQDYIRTAWAKGLGEYLVVARHAMKNALIPIVTIAGGMIPLMIGGTIIIEQIFDLPGVGLFMYQALTSRDYPIVSGVNVFLASTILIMNLVVDLTYAWLDPRIQYK